MGLLAAVLAMAAVALVLGGGQPAVAAGDCQYSPYGPYGDSCPKATPSLTVLSQGPSTVGGGHLLIVALSGGSKPGGTLESRLYGIEHAFLTPDQIGPASHQDRTSCSNVT